MKYQYTFFYLFVILFLCINIKNAQAGCETYKNNPIVDINVEYGKVYYDNNKSSAQFPEKPYASTMGLTVSDFKQQLTADSAIFPQSDGSFCVTLKKVNATFGFPRINVYIDKKYRPGSCNYKVIKEHENYHVRVQQEGLRFFESKLRQAIKIASKTTSPERAYSMSEATEIAQKMVIQIQKKIKPTFDYVQKRLIEENMVIDTPESYIAENKKCKKW